MRAFSCGNCGALVFFENSVCLRCNVELGFDPDERAIVCVGTAGRRCGNQTAAACNWLVNDDNPLCRSCRLTRIRPNDADTEALGEFAHAESAKRRLVFQLLELGLPVADDNPAFELLLSRERRVVTGHIDGVITIDLAESDDAHRELLRTQLGEPYRTMLGHFRHEIGHYYWPLLVGSGPIIDEWRERFGDERADYAAALNRHYRDGPVLEFVGGFVSAYAATHPWEDWAETFAHYLHIRDTLQTASSYGMLLTGPVTDPPSRPAGSLVAAPAADSADDFGDILADWLPLTYALNAVNRSMGKDDLYPFVLAPLVVDKLAFVHRRVIEATTTTAGR